MKPAAQKTAKIRKRQLEERMMDIESRLRKCVEEEYKMKYEREILSLKKQLEQQKNVVEEIKKECDGKIWEIEKFYIHKIGSLRGEEKAEEVAQEAERIKQKLKERVRLIEDVKEKENNGRNKAEEEFNKLLITAQSEIQSIKDYTDDLEEKLKDLISVVKEEIPPILRQENRILLPMIVENLNPRFFSRLIQSSKRLNNLAQVGFLKNDVYLGIEMEEQSSTPSVLYKGRKLNIPDIANLLNAPWTKVHIESLEIISNPTTVMYGMNGEEMDRDLMNLLKYMNVDYISRVRIHSEVPMFGFMKVCNIGTLDAEMVESLDFLEFAENIEVRHFYMEFYEEYGFGFPTPYKPFEDFIVNSSAVNLSIKYFFFSRDFVSRIVLAWQSGERNFNSIRLDLYREDESRILSDVLNANKVLHVGRRLNEISYKEITNLLHKTTPMVLCGDDNTFVIIREDKSMMSVIFHINEFPKVKLRRVYKVEEEDEGEDEDEDEENEAEDEDEDEDEDEEDEAAGEDEDDIE